MLMHPGLLVRPILPRNVQKFQLREWGIAQSVATDLSDQEWMKCDRLRTLSPTLLTTWKPVRHNNIDEKKRIVVYEEVLLPLGNIINFFLLKNY